MSFVMEINNPRKPPLITQILIPRPSVFRILLNFASVGGRWLNASVLFLPCPNVIVNCLIVDVRRSKNYFRGRGLMVVSIFFGH